MASRKYYLPSSNSTSPTSPQPAATASNPHTTYTPTSSTTRATSPSARKPNAFKDVVDAAVTTSKAKTTNTARGASQERSMERSGRTRTPQTRTSQSAARMTSPPPTSSAPSRGGGRTPVIVTTLSPPSPTHAPTPPNRSASRSPAPRSPRNASPGPNSSSLSTRYDNRLSVDQRSNNFQRDSAGRGSNSPRLLSPNSNAAIKSPNSPSPSSFLVSPAESLSGGSFSSLFSDDDLKRFRLDTDVRVGSSPYSTSQALNSNSNYSSKAQISPSVSSPSTARNTPTTSSNAIFAAPANKGNQNKSSGASSTSANSRDSNPQRQISLFTLLKLVQRQIRLSPKGHLVINFPVTGKLLEGAAYKEEEEFTRLRYTALTDPPASMKRDKHLRQITLNRPTRLAVLITLANEPPNLLCATLHAITQNLSHLTSGLCAGWTSTSWSEVVVTIIADGRCTLHPGTARLLELWGIYNPHLPKASIDGTPIKAHLFEFSSQVSVNGQMKIRRPQTPAQRKQNLEDGIDPYEYPTVPMPMVLLLKEKVGGKMDSHRWFFEGVCLALEPEVCMFVEAGTRPVPAGMFHLYHAFVRKPDLAGACGDVTPDLGPRLSNLLNPLVAYQNFEYKISNTLEKPLESVFGYLPVLPSQFSAYRYTALLGEPLKAYFRLQDQINTQGMSSLGEANRCLSGERVLCFELVVKREGGPWVLKYVKSARAYTDVPSTLPALLLQRRRWNNGAFFANLHAGTTWIRIWDSQHSTSRKVALCVEMLWIWWTLLWGWFGIGIWYLLFFFLLNVSSTITCTPTSNASDSALDPFHPAGPWIVDALRSSYTLVLAVVFIAALGNRPEGSRTLYLCLSIVFALFTAFQIFFGIWNVKVSTSAFQRSRFNDNTADGFWTYTLQNPTFRDLVVSSSVTGGVYVLSAIVHLDPWHLLSCLVQYLLLLPSVVNLCGVYAFCNLHDLTWGSKDQPTAPAIPTVQTTQTPQGTHIASVPAPEDPDSDWKAIRAAIKEESRLLHRRAPEPPATKSRTDFLKTYRTRILLLWLATNGLMAYILTHPAFVNFLFPNAVRRSQVHPFVTFVLWTVSFMSCVKLVFTIIYLVGWWGEGVEDAGKRRVFGARRRNGWGRGNDDDDDDESDV
ncbi:Chitin synthase, class 2 [Chytridiales sp. JEL 0842]|nr:Chitin synthase, class 2 [Chytridiales sp. JEL 0842]